MLSKHALPTGVAIFSIVTSKMTIFLPFVTSKMTFFGWPFLKLKWDWLWWWHVPRSTALHWYFCLRIIISGVVSFQSFALTSSLLHLWVKLSFTLPSMPGGCLCECDVHSVKKEQTTRGRLFTWRVDIQGNWGKSRRHKISASYHWKMVMVSSSLWRRICVFLQGAALQLRAALMNRRKRDAMMVLFLWQSWCWVRCHHKILGGWERSIHDGSQLTVRTTGRKILRIEITFQSLVDISLFKHQFGWRELVHCTNGRKWPQPVTVRESVRSCQGNMHMAIQ